MKKITLLTLITASLLFNACGEDAEKVASDAKAVVEAKAQVAAKRAEEIRVATAQKALEAQLVLESVAAKAMAEVAEKAKAMKEAAAQKALEAQLVIEEASARVAIEANLLKEAIAKKALEGQLVLEGVAEQVVTEVTSMTDAEALKEIEAIEASAKKSMIETVAPVVTNEVGKAAYAKCQGCHGADGTTKALGKAGIVSGQSALELEAKLLAYKAGTRNEMGMGMLMKGQVASMDNATIKAVSEYMSGL